MIRWSGVKRGATFFGVWAWEIGDGKDLTRRAQRPEKERSRRRIAEKVDLDFGPWEKQIYRRGAEGAEKTGSAGTFALGHAGVQLAATLLSIGGRGPANPAQLVRGGVGWGGGAATDYCIGEAVHFFGLGAEL